MPKSCLKSLVRRGNALFSILVWLAICSVVTHAQKARLAERTLAEANKLKTEWKSESFKLAARKYARAQGLFHLACELRREAETLEKLGDVSALFSDYQGAIVHYNQALPIAESLKDERLEAVVLTKLGGAYLEMANVKKASLPCSRALEYFRASRFRGRRRIGAELPGRDEPDSQRRFTSAGAIRARARHRAKDQSAERAGANTAQPGLPSQQPGQRGACAQFLQSRTRDLAGDQRATETRFDVDRDGQRLHSTRRETDRVRSELPGAQVIPHHRASKRRSRYFKRHRLPLRHAWRSRSVPQMFYARVRALRGDREPSLRRGHVRLYRSRALRAG